MNSELLKAPSRTALGREAEAFVVERLEALGLPIEARNLRLGALEIDIVLRDGRTIALVEVRRRGPGSLTRPLSSVGYPKRVFLERAAARLWRMRYSKDNTVDRMRLDIAAVIPTGDGFDLEYVRGALPLKSRP